MKYTSNSIKTVVLNQPADSFDLGRKCVHFMNERTVPALNINGKYGQCFENCFKLKMVILPNVVF